MLDNVRSFPQLRPLLPGGGRSVVLATSRESLGDLTGDYTALSIRLRMLEPTEATALLIKLAGADRFGSDPVAVEQLGALCDCLPLALRIAGARLAAKPNLSVRSLVERLRDQRGRLDVLSPGEGGVRAGFRLTYRDLPAEAARMYRRLGLLRTADFAAWAGAAVLDTTVWHAEELIDQLVDAQLLEVASADPGRAARYRFQDLLRLFARERAESDEPEGDTDAALERAFAAWLWLAEEAHRRIDGRRFPVSREQAPARLPAGASRRAGGRTDGLVRIGALGGDGHGGPRRRDGPGLVRVDADPERGAALRDEELPGGLAAQRRARARRRPAQRGRARRGDDAAQPGLTGDLPAALRAGRGLEQGGAAAAAQHR